MQYSLSINFFCSIFSYFSLFLSIFPYATIIGIILSENSKPCEHEHNHLSMCSQCALILRCFCIRWEIVRAFDLFLIVVFDCIIINNAVTLNPNIICHRFCIHHTAAAVALNMHTYTLHTNCILCLVVFR